LKGKQVVGPDPLSKQAKRMIHLARLDSQQPFSLASLRRVGWKLKDQAQTSADGLVIARTQMKLQRLCKGLVAQTRALHLRFPFRIARHICEYRAKYSKV
jgi:hypothetical protein